MAFAVNVFVLGLCLVISVAFQGEWNYESKGKPIAPRFKREVNTAMFDLEKHVSDKLRRKYKNEDKTLVWIVMNGSHPDLGEKPDLAKSVVKVDVRNVNAGKASPPKDKVSGLFRNMYCNSQTMPLSSKIKQTVKRNATFTYRAKKGLKRINENGIPIELQLPASLQRENASVETLTVNLMGKKSEAQSVTDTHELDYDVTVAPKMAKEVTIMLIYKVVNVEYDADLVLTGAVVAMFKGKDGVQQYASHPVSDFGDSNYVKEGDSLVFHTIGQFTGSRSFKVDVKEKDIKIDADQCKHDELQSEGDVRIIHLKPPAPKTEDLMSRK